MLILIPFAFLSGLATVFAPCIWPIIPIIFSSSLGSRRKSTGIVLGLMLSFFLLTLITSSIVKSFSFDESLKNLIAAIIIALLGLSMLIPALEEKVELLLSKISHSFGIKIDANTRGLKAGLLTGLALGLIWSPCAGPIMASMIALNSARPFQWQIFTLTAIYILGFGLPMLAFTWFGKTLLEKSSYISAYLPVIQKTFGVLMILIAIAIYTHFDKFISIKILDSFPLYAEFIRQTEGSQLVDQGLTDLMHQLKGK